MTKAERAAALGKHIEAAGARYHRALDQVCRTGTPEAVAEFFLAQSWGNDLERIRQDVEALP